jgi:hypothetical protein
MDQVVDIVKADQENRSLGLPPGLKCLGNGIHQPPERNAGDIV